MSDALRRVSIHYGWIAEGDPITVDLALPASITVGELIPSIVEACGAGDGIPKDWRLRTVAGPSLDASMTLSQHNIHDGDLLLLAPEPVPKPSARVDTVTAALAAGVRAPAGEGGLQLAGCVWLCVSGALAVGWAGLGAHGLSRFGVAALLVMILAAAVVGARRMRAAPALVTTLSVAAAVHGAALGFLIVPAGPDAANVFLAAVAAVSAGTVLLRITDCGTTLLLAVASFAAAVAVAAGCQVVRPLDLAALGAVLGAVAVGGLALAPRLSIVIADLNPAIPGAADERDVDDVAVRAACGHRTLTGLVAGCAAAAALGTLLIAVGARDAVSPAAVGFTTAVGVALVLRSRSYASGLCRTALSCAGLLGLTATFVLIVMWTPQHGDWLGLLAVAAGLVLLGPAAAAGPVALRIIDGLEYVALAAVAPLTCWLTGVFDAIGPR